MTNIRVDTSQLKKMALDLEKTVPGTRIAVVAALKEGGGLVAAEARSLSSWSSRIPGSIRVGGGLNKIVVRAGGGRAPHAAAYEHGGLPGVFRHPVFGNRRVWVKQAARPFLAPAAEHKADAVESAVAAGVDVVFRLSGF